MPNKELRFFLKTYLLFLLVFCLNCTSILAQNYLPNTITTTNKIYQPNIKTVQVRFNNRQPSYPVLALNELGSSLVFMFDDLSDEVKDYTYRIVQCRANWELSDLDPFEFIDGFNEDVIRNYRYSFDTRQTYVSYQFELPNAMTEFKKSGNYVVYVYENDNENKPVFTQRFVVYENLVGFDSQIIQPNLNRYFKTHQRLQFDVRYDILQKAIYPTNIDPMNDFSVTILQNGRWDNAIYHLRPFLFRKQTLQYYHTDQTLFSAGREFRYFDFRNLEFLSERVKKSYLYNGYNHIELAEDQVRQHENIRLWEDFNGAFVIGLDASRIFSADADYAWVKFSLQADSTLQNGDIYVYGGLTNWQILDDAKMQFNPDKNIFYTKLFLKQGTYNYQYVFLPHSSSGQNDTNPNFEDFDVELIEGSYWNTENDYIILVYFRSFGAQYDRVVGATLINSLR